MKETSTWTVSFSLGAKTAVGGAGAAGAAIGTFGDGLLG